MTKKAELGKQIDGKIWVRKTIKDGDENYKEEKLILTECFTEEPSQAEAKVGITLNLGNYESMRIDVGVRIPCYKSELHEAITKAIQFATKELDNGVEEVRETLGYDK